MIESHIGRLDVLMGMHSHELNQEHKQKLVTDLECCIGWFEGLENTDQDQKKQAAKWYNYRGLIYSGRHNVISADDYRKFLKQ